MSGFIKLNRDGFVDLIKHPFEFHLLTVIAWRARRTASLDGSLQPGEALIGDWENMGFSRQNYRRAKANLQTWGIITTKPTTKGTVARLCDSRFYDLNLDEPNHQTNQQPTINPTINQPTPNQRPTTNKKERSKEGEEVKECKNTPLGEEVHVNGSSDSPKEPDWKLFMDYWNLNVPFSTIRTMSEDRKKSFRVRMADPFFRENYREGIAMIPNLPFCCGENDRGWRANVDWFLKPKALAGIMEGRYASAPRQTANCL